MAGTVVPMYIVPPSDMTWEEREDEIRELKWKLDSIQAQREDHLRSIALLDGDCQWVMDRLDDLEGD